MVKRRSIYDIVAIFSYPHRSWSWIGCRLDCSAWHKFSRCLGKLMYSTVCNLWFLYSLVRCVFPITLTFLLAMKQWFSKNKVYLNVISCLSYCCAGPQFVQIEACKTIFRFFRFIFVVEFLNIIATKVRKARNFLYFQYCANKTIKCELLALIKISASSMQSKTWFNV